MARSIDYGNLMHRAMRGLIQTVLRDVAAHVDDVRHHALRRDGTVRDTVMYSLTVGEWPEVKAHLNWQLSRPRP